MPLRTQARIAAVEKKIEASASDPDKAVPRKEHKTRALPEHLPRVERVIEPESIACPCGCGNMIRIGEDRTQRLDRIPARYEVIVTIRPKYACPKGRTGVVQARAPAHLLEGSWPTEALLAEIAVSKHSEHMPLNRQAEVMARHGVPIDRTVLADWMGRTGSEIAPVVDHMAKRLLSESTRLYVDETTAPVLGPGRGKTKTGYLWAVLRDDRSLPLVDEFFAWLAAQAKRVSRKSDLAKVLAYMLTRQDGFRLFLDDGHVDIDSNLVDIPIRLVDQNERNARTLLA